MGKVFLLFVAATLLEIFVFIEVGSAIGAMSTIVLILLSAIVGLSLVRIQGFQTLMEAQRKVSLGEPPAREMLGGIMLALSGILLVLPGFVSDMLGLLLLLPPVREALVARLLSKVKMQTRQQGHTFSGEFHHTDGSDQQARLDEFLKSHQNNPQQDGAQSNKQDSGTTFEGDFERKDDK
ncbi:FxsA protein [Oceanisphaera profunda]|uniref:FxsA protein n=1 Tax=Oceanisphaera profunda TaxID=1416627 RepID=A0A1Y0D6Y5_9GAMM|nr:FxsA family protein [Oceanisphaera profunda]ART83064.1 FxsA protein [Oceanisphaera profunda]